MTPSQEGKIKEKFAESTTTTATTLTATPTTAATATERNWETVLTCSIFCAK